MGGDGAGGGGAGVRPFVPDTHVGAKRPFSSFDFRKQLSSDEDPAAVLIVYPTHVGSASHAAHACAGHESVAPVRAKERISFEGKHSFACVVHVGLSPIAAAMPTAFGSYLPVGSAHFAPSFYGTCEGGGSQIVSRIRTK